MGISHLSRHFCDNWERRVGGVASLDAVRAIIRESVKVQHCKDLIDRAGHTCRQLAVYWHPDLEVIITVDHIAEVAVSVLSRDNQKGRDNGKNH